MAKIKKITRNTATTNDEKSKYCFYVASMVRPCASQMIVVVVVFVSLSSYRNHCHHRCHGPRVHHRHRRRCRLRSINGVLARCCIETSTFDDEETSIVNFTAPANDWCRRRQTSHSITVFTKPVVIYVTRPWFNAKKIIILYNDKPVPLKEEGAVSPKLA